MADRIDPTQRELDRRMNTAAAAGHGINVEAHPEYDSDGSDFGSRLGKMLGAGPIEDDHPASQNHPLNKPPGAMDQVISAAKKFWTRIHGGAPDAQTQQTPTATAPTNVGK